ncbi:MAG TPA: serine hydrolase domain-containing protein [Pyrinomonadaceae bacterium]|nr:serine hydrolase domain-containing protein [Pyrinomonadaceae bacterium]
MTQAANSVSEFLKERVQAGDFPSAVYIVGEAGRAVFKDSIGNAVVEPSRIPATLDTIYDLASLTKPLITGLLSARRIESREIALDVSVAEFLPEFSRHDKQLITVGQLLTHTSGLPAWRPLYILAEGKSERALAAIANVDLEYAPGTRVIYSDLGFITLGLLLEKLSGRPLSELALEEIIHPLGLERTFFNPALAMQTGIAACETGNAYERNTCAESNAGEYQSWREDIIWGQVHDGNAHFLGGAAGHAGLFSTARETLILANQFLGRGTEDAPADQVSLLKNETLDLFRQNLTAGLEESRSVGWMLAESSGSSAGPDLPPKSFGHTGFTGTSCWIDPQHDRVFILLTNRTHARALPFVNLNSVRRQFHSLAVGALVR